MFLLPASVVMSCLMSDRHIWSIVVTEELFPVCPYGFNALSNALYNDYMVTHCLIIALLMA